MPSKIIEPAIEVHSRGERSLRTPAWPVTQLRHWQNIRTQELRKKMNVTVATQRPIGSLTIFPSIDPYTPRQRQEFRAIHENISWINRAIKIMVASVIGSGFTITIEPRAEDEQLEDEQLDEWKKTQKFKLPLVGAIEDEDQWTGLELEKFLMNYTITLDLQSHLARAYRYVCEQGNCGIMMLPEYKFNKEGEIDERDGEFILPKVLRTIRPEHITKIWLDLNTGEMSSLQVIGIQSNGGKLPVERLIWLTAESNLELHTDFYGESKLLPLLDVGKVQGILYAKDMVEAAQYTWHQPKVYQVEIPPRDFKNVNQVLRDFLRRNNNASGRDIAVTQNVTLISGQSNTGDIAGLLSMDDHIIDQEAGFFNIPPFLLSKGKAGNLGGNAQSEEVDAFLNIEVRPQQEIVERFIEKQFFDRILQIMFSEKDPDKVPIRARLNLIKPDLVTLFNKEQYEIMLDMVQRKLLSEDKMIERLNLDKMKLTSPVTKGGDPNPAENVWNRSSKKRNPHWQVSNSKWKSNGNAPFWNERPSISFKEVKKTPVENKWT